MQGVGTLISKQPRLVYPIGRRTRFSEGFGSVASTTSMTLVSDTVVAAGGDFSEPLQLGEGALAVALDVLGWVDDQPVSLAHYWFPENRFAGLAQAFSAHRSISAALASFGIADYVRVDTEIIGRIASAAETRLLQLPAGSVVLEARYMNADLDGKPIQYSQVIFRADRVSLKMEAI